MLHHAISYLHTRQLITLHNTVVCAAVTLGSMLEDSFQVLFFSTMQQDADITMGKQKLDVCLLNVAGRDNSNNGVGDGFSIAGSQLLTW